MAEQRPIRAAIPEMELEMARRHAREGRERIERQQEILLELLRISTPELVESARETLALMRRVQEGAERHLARLEG